MLDSLWQVFVSLALCLMCFEHIRLRRDVRRTLRLLNGAAEALLYQEVPE